MPEEIIEYEDPAKEMLKKLEGLVKIQAIMRGFLTRRKCRFKPSH